jgi:GMP synthase (glutamine-hydrolysing)
MRIHWLQHVPFEGLGSIADWSAARGHTLSATRLWADEPLPATTDFDWLIVLGGPMNIYEHDRFPWLVAEKRFLREAIQAGRTALGICLGAQLLADVLGGRVIRNGEREIGWYPVRQTQEASGQVAVAGLPSEFTAFHWHGDTFTLPPGALQLARSDACEQQAFWWNRRVLGLQFHLETTPDSAAALLANCGQDLTPGRFVQDARSIQADHARFQSLNRLMNGVLDSLARAT